jgi:hypothetical protein
MLTPSDTEGLSQLTLIVEQSMTDEFISMRDPFIEYNYINMEHYFTKFNCFIGLSSSVNESNIYNKCVPFNRKDWQIFIN